MLSQNFILRALWYIEPVTGVPPIVTTLFSFCLIINQPRKPPNTFKAVKLDYDEFYGTVNISSL